MRYFFRKLKAATIIETLVALTIIMVVFAIGMTIFTNVIIHADNLSKLEACVLLEDIAIETHRTEKYLAETLRQGRFTIKKDFTGYNKIPDLYFFSLEAYNHHQHLLATRNELVYLP